MRRAVVQILGVFLVMCCAEDVVHPTDRLVNKLLGVVFHTWSISHASHARHPASFRAEPSPRLSQAQLKARDNRMSLETLSHVSRSTRVASFGRIGGAVPMRTTVDDDVLARADQLHEEGQVDALFDLLLNADTSDDAIAWRVARAYHDKAEECIGDDVRKEQLLRQGFAIADAAQQASGSGPALKWYAILLGRLGDFLPTKEKVANSYKIKESLEKAAVELPTDASIRTALGQWCFKVASISWVERNAAKLLFGAPPTSSYDEALSFAKQSYDIRPSKRAALLAGQCHSKLKQADQAREWFERCISIKSVGESDKEFDREANKLIIDEIKLASF